MKSFLGFNRRAKSVEQPTISPQKMGALAAEFPEQLSSAPTMLALDGGNEGGDESDNIQIRRSDGLRHDFKSVRAIPGVSDAITFSVKQPVSGRDRNEEDDHGHISIPRSDGVTHDIIRVLNKYYTDASGDTLRMKREDFAAKAKNGRQLSVGKLEIPSFVLNQSSKNQVPPPPPENTPNPSVFYMKKVRIVHMSDTHHFLDKQSRNGFLPNGHILVHSGNFTDHGTDEEFTQFNGWLESVSDRYHYRVIVLGNRDVKVYGNDWDSMKKLLPAATHVLCHTEATILGIRFYGAPWHWGHKKNYMLRQGAPTTTTGRFDDIPLGINVLVTHGPAMDRLDVTNCSETREHWGSAELLDALRRVKPGVHLHGHVKDARGFISAFGNLPLTVNSAMCDVNVSVMYAAPHVIRADQVLLDPIKNVVDWTFALDSLDG
jgi:Icc-related predicted phosphoesterase